MARLAAVAQGCVDVGSSIETDLGEAAGMQASDIERRWMCASQPARLLWSGAGHATLAAGYGIAIMTGGDLDGNHRHCVAQVCTNT